MKRFLQWIKNLFSREINPYPVSDKAVFRNVDKTLTLYVRSNATALVVNIRDAHEQLLQLTDESDECQRMNAARRFAASVFGDEQADMLCDFYNEPMAVVAVVGQYFEKRLGRLITKAQKR